MDGAFETDGTDGWLKYTTVADFLDEAGTWTGQVYLAGVGGWTGHSETFEFIVYETLS